MKVIITYLTKINFQRKEDPTMRKMTYYFGVWLLMFSLMAAGSSFARTEMEERSDYFPPATTGWETFKASDLLGVQLHTREMISVKSATWWSIRQRNGSR
jgi:hypothetical protein